jgi:hypothetical protein
MRYIVLVSGTICSALILSLTLSTAKGWGIALAWAISFQLGLRGQALLGYAKRRAAKELSWSWALAASFAVTLALLMTFRTPQWRFILFVLAWEACVFYCVGKLTCALTGCCNAHPYTHITRPPLPIWEIAATITALVTSVPVVLAGSCGAALELLAIAHAVIRFGSRYGRTLVLRRAVAVDTVGLALIAVTAGSLSW